MASALHTHSDPRTIVIRSHGGYSRARRSLTCDHALSRGMGHTHSLIPDRHTAQNNKLYSAAVSSAHAHGLVAQPSRVRVTVPPILKAHMSKRRCATRQRRHGHRAASGVRDTLADLFLAAAPRACTPPCSRRERQSEDSSSTKRALFACRRRYLVARATASCGAA